MWYICLGNAWADNSVVGGKAAMTKIAALLLFVVATLAPSAGRTHDHGAKGIEIVHAWAPVMIEADTKSTTVYMTIKNRSGSSDRLIGARATVATKIEIHEPGNSVATVTIDAGKDLELSSTGLPVFDRGEQTTAAA
jgi:copper(I)-binding protein